MINYVDFWLKTPSRAMKRYESKVKLLILLYLRLLGKILSVHFDDEPDIINHFRPLGIYVLI